MSDKCNFCNKPIYFKAIKYTASLLQPITKSESLRQQLEDLTGEVYVLVDSKYCPMCGRLLKENKIEK